MRHILEKRRNTQGKNIVTAERWKMGQRTELEMGGINKRSNRQHYGGWERIMKIKDG